MRIAFIEIENFRGIKVLQWAPSSGVNCLIGPGDSTKTTVLDAVELCLNPRSYISPDDCDFFDLDVKNPIRITVTLGSLPLEFKADNRYGLHLRGWNAQAGNLEDEPGPGLEDVLSIALVIDESLEARWSIFNERIVADEKEPPTVRYKDAKLFATTRLGPYADRHLGWGRSSVLTRISETGGGFGLQLAEASRAARKAFRAGEQAVFTRVIERAEELSKRFAVPVRGKYTAELDVDGVNITSGGIALHDENLPLRRLGTGSSRLIVSALQHDAGPPHIALIDEIEYGLEPHRIARLLKYLKTPKDGAGLSQPQIFMTTHSPFVLLELAAQDIFAVRSAAGTTTVRSVSATAKDLDTAQRHLRGTPEAFLARKILVGEGKTEQGLARGFDTWWTGQNKDSFALQGMIAIDGGGKDKAPLIAEHLLDLGYKVFLLLDSDEAPNADALKRVTDKGGAITQWPDACSTEERIFLDVPWEVVRHVVGYARECIGDDNALAEVNIALADVGLEKIDDLTLPDVHDNINFRRALGKAAKNKRRSWFKDISRSERLAEMIGPCLDDLAAKPLTQKLAELRTWIDA